MYIKVLLTGLLSSLFFISTANAAETMIMPGSACNLTTGDFKGQFKKSFDTIQSLGTTAPIEVSCPVKRVNGSSIDTSTFEVNVWHPNIATYTTSCVLMRRGLIDTPAASRQNIEPTGTGAGMLTLKFHSLPTPDDDQTVYALKCQLKGGSAIIGYKWSTVDNIL